jgi:hypothetical protein
MSSPELIFVSDFLLIRSSDDPDLVKQVLGQSETDVLEAGRSESNANFTVGE